MDDKKMPADRARLLAALEATWPPAETVERGGWTLRRGAEGGQRVSAASGAGDIGLAEAQMRAWGQAPLFRLSKAQTDLDVALAHSGYVAHDSTVFYSAPAAALAGTQSHIAAAYTCAFRPAIMEEIWHQGGIGPGRLGVMDRAAGPKSFLLSRAADTPAAVGFVAMHSDIAMLHAIEVLPTLRRQGAAILLIEAAARFALDHGGALLALAVTEANTGARALYERLGMDMQDGYHYRRKLETSS